jgi:hypothetical protein
MVVLAGCVDETPAPTHIEISTIGVNGNLEEPAMDACGLAAALPANDICSLVCDPDAMAEQMAVTGSQPGKCYQLYCQLSENEHVLVGICLAP